MNYDNQFVSPYVSPQAKSWFKTILIGAASILVLLLLCIHFGWSTLAGLIFALVGIACSVGCFFADTVKSMFGKGRAVTLGLVSLYLDLMATLAFATPNFFAGLGLNGWIGLTTLFFAATLGGSLALVQFQKASKIVSALIITLTLFGLLAGQTFSRGVQYLVGNMGNAFGRNVYLLGSKLEDSAADIRVKYQTEYQKKKSELDKDWEAGKLSAKDYESRRKALDQEYSNAFAQPETSESSSTPTVTKAPTNTNALIDGRYQILGNGSEVKDLQTGLIWQRCSVGQEWNGSTCTGQARKFNNFEVAQRLEGSGWRIPIVRELASLIYCSTGQMRKHSDPKDGGRVIHNNCGGNYISPALVNAAFPATHTESYWSSSNTAHLGDETIAWVVDFHDGSVGTRGRDLLNPVRMVRSGQ